MRTPSKNVSLTIRLLRTYYVAYREEIAYEHAPPLPDVSRGKSKGPRNILVALIGEEELAKLDDWLKNESRYLLIPCTATLTFTDNDFHQMLKAMKITL